MTSFRVAILAALAAGATFVPQARAQTASVTISNFKFAPETVTVSPNMPVNWTNNDGAPHQVVVASKKLSTPVLSKGQSAQLRIAEPGTYDYVCGIHASMRGRIAVK
jgi:plastocyanin